MRDTKKRVALGDFAEDTITGFRGVVTGHAKYITGCDQFLLAPKCERGKDFVRPQSEWFDEKRLKVVVKGSVQFDNSDPEDNGADMPAPAK